MSLSNTEAPTKWALMSMYDKTGGPELAQALVKAGYGLLSSGGTAKVLRDEGFEVTDVADYTGSPIMLGHRVATLHPKVHGGILCVRTDPEHQADMAEHGIMPIDVVVVNLYPFADKPSIELIDVGGPTMVRGGAKNHEFVAILVDPTDYEDVIRELEISGQISLDTRVELAYKAFRTTRDYDAQIVAWLEKRYPRLKKLSGITHTERSVLELVQSLGCGAPMGQAGGIHAFCGDVIAPLCHECKQKQVALHATDPLTWINLVRQLAPPLPKPKPEPASA